MLTMQTTSVAIIHKAHGTINAMVLIIPPAQRDLPAEFQSYLGYALILV